ncbi:MAG TPA: NUDIX domain-containing protein [Chloroflexota bacterium]|nr:NUDIX domain-containing protein [Chloroflexota bacterium]
MRLNGGRDRPHCPAPGCGFIFFGDFSIGCGGVVIRDGKALLVQRGMNPGKGSWQIPGGYVEADEEVASAVVRECLEEAGITAEVTDVLGFRHSIGGQGSIGGPSTNIYVVFRLRPIAGEPTCDGVETAAAGYFSLEEIESMERVQSLSKWAIQRALCSGPGLSPVYRASDLSRPGWTLFGLPLPEGVEQVPLARPAPTPLASQPPESLPPTAGGAEPGTKA